MVSANEILNYRGNPDDALATGGGPWGVAQGGATSTASRDLALAALGRNKQMYEQRIADRDKVYKMIDDDALIPKDILDQDRPRIDAKLKDIEDTFLNNNGDVLSDPARYREYISKIQSAKADIAQAAKRYVAVNAENEAGLKDNPTDLADRKAYIQKYLNDPNGFYKTYSPYVKMNSFDLNVVHPKPTYGEDKTSFTKDKDGHWKVTENTLDVPKLFGNLRAAYADKDKNYMFTNSQGHGYVDELLGHPNADKYVEGINKGIDKYNADLGLKKGDANYVSHIDDQLIKNPDNSYRLAYPGAAPDVAGKMVVAENEAKTTKREPVSELNTYDLGKQRVGVEWYNAFTERMKANKEAEFKDWQIKNGSSSSTSGKENHAWDFATHTILDIAKQGQFVKDHGSVGSIKQDGTLLTPDKLNKLTPDQKKYLGTTETKDGKMTIKDADINDGDALFIADDGKIYKIPANKLVKGETNKKGTDFNWQTSDAVLLTDRNQIATTRLKDEEQSSSGSEIGTFNGPDTKGATQQYDQKNSKKGGGTQLKSSYMIKGKSYTPEDLKKIGYTDQQIIDAHNNGNIK